MKGTLFTRRVRPTAASAVPKNARASPTLSTITGTQTIKRTVTLYLSNLAGEARAAELTERVPVSEIDGLEIKLTEVPGWQPDPKDGYLKRQVNVAPRANETLTFKYEIKAAKNVQLPF